MNMKKLLAFISLSVITFSSYAFTGNTTESISSPDKEQAGKSGEVIVMNKEMFLKEIFDYQNENEWKFKGDKPVIIDLYADWCGPCRQAAPIMKSLAQEYKDKIVIYKINVDIEKELAALFNASSIPLFVFIPMDQEPQLFRGLAPKETYKKAIDEFLLGKK